MNRRSFIRKSGAIGASAFLGSLLSPELLFSGGLFAKPDICIYSGNNYFDGTLKIIEKIGGMGKFVSQGQKVGLLVNSDFEIPGAYVNPDIVLAVVKAVQDAGAGEISCIQNIKKEYWERSSYHAEFADIISKIKNNETNSFPAKYDPESFVKIDKIEGSKCLEEVEVTKAVLDCDVLINIPIAKHHALTLYTGALKNMMGVCTRNSCVFFHLGSGKRNDPDFLGQSIADINLLRYPDLIIADATQFITTNGPVGPGEMKVHDKIVAGTDLVAMDTLCSSYLDLSTDEVVMLGKAEESGLGSMDLSQYKIKEYTA